MKTLQSDNDNKTNIKNSTFEHGKIDQILSDLADLILIFKELRDKKLIEDVFLKELSQYMSTYIRPLSIAE